MAKMVHLSVQSRYRLVLLTLAVLFVHLLWPGASLFSISATSIVQWADDHYPSLYQNLQAREQVSDPIPAQIPFEMYDADLLGWGNENSTPREKFYKPPPKKTRPVPDPFPLLSQNPPPKASPLQAPPINRPPRRHYAEKTPLFVGFTRNWPQLLQCVVSYIAAGWPPEDIYVVENTGVMLANQEGKLTLQNPFYLNHTQLGMLGVNVIIVRPPSPSQFTALYTDFLFTDPNAPHLFPTPKLLPLVIPPLPLPLSLPNP